MTLALVVTGLLALGMVALGIGLWFRRSDRRVQAGTRDRLHELVSFDEIPESPAPANRIGDRF
jgi:hypothetical protein